MDEVADHEWRFTVLGRPRSKGSHCIMPRGGRRPIGGRYALSDLWVADHMGKELKAWTKAIQAAALDCKPRNAMVGAFEVHATCYFTKPRTVGTEHATRFTKAPDADKLARTIGDALTGVFWKDDCMISDWIMRCRWTDDVPHTEITIMCYKKQIDLSI